MKYHVSSGVLKLRFWSAPDSNFNCCTALGINPIRPGLFSRSPGPGGSEAQMPKIEVNINQLKSNLA